MVEIIVGVIFGFFWLALFGLSNAFSFAGLYRYPGFAESLGGMVIKERIVKTMRESYLDEVVYKIPKTDS
jgi:hypothetical protein